MTIGPFTVEAVPVEHPVEAYGLRVAAGGASIAYTGDTGAVRRSSYRLAAGADLLLAEASFRHERRQPARDPPHRHRLRRARRAAPASGGW